MTPIRRLAERIADNLFTDARGRTAERLLLWSDSRNKDSGGWCKRAVADAIEDEIKSAIFSQGREG